MKRILLSFFLIIFSVSYAFGAATVYPKHKWNLNDEFSTPLSAGSVNGTPSDGTRAQRTVVDTESKLSITGGNLSFSGGKASPSQEDPLIKYPSISRTPGTMIIGQALDISQRINIFGVTGSDVNNATAGHRQISTTNISTNLNVSLGGLSVASVIVGSVYYFALALETSGNFHFVKGGVFTNWELLYRNPFGTESPTYPIIGSYNGAFTSSFIRIPSERWLPTPLLSHGFQSGITPSDGAGHAETSGLGSGGAGLTMTQQLGTWGMVSQTAQSSALDGTLNISILTASLSTVNQVISVDLTRTSTGNVGIAFRYTDSNNYNICYQDGTHVKCDDVVNGTPTNKLSATATYGAGYKMVVVADGSAVRCYYNNALIGIYTTSNTGGANTGLYTSDTGNTFDKLVVYPRGNEGQYSYLDQFVTP